MAALPNLLIIGAPKCGTSSLHFYLDQHPQIQMSEPKELNFFTRQKPNSRRGLGWYASHFDPDYPVRGETSSYAFFPYARGAPKLASETVPDARLLYLVGDPGSRILSHYVHRVSAGRERRSFAEVLDSLPTDLEADEASELPGPPGYLARSLYHLQLQQWRAYFPDSSILVIDQSELRSKRAAALAEIALFLGLEDRFPEAGISEVHNPSEGKRRPSRFGRWARWIGSTTGSKKLLPATVRGSLISSNTFTRTLERPELSPTERERLADLVRDDVDSLRSLTGKSFAEWSV